MSRIGTLMICAATLALGLGCDDGRGGEDGGGIVLMDSGPDTTPDTGTPPPPTDSGPAPSGCSVAGAMGFPALPAGCLPRCSSATFDAVVACGMDGACQQSAISSDTTPGTDVDLGMGMVQNIDCNGCFSWQVNSCVFESCPDQFAACTMCEDGCNPDTAGCETEEGALDSCLMANGMALQGCVNGRAGACFDMSGGFLPDFEGRQLPQLSPATLGRVIRQLPAGFPR
ncbi:MAG: hypothetical protein SangKO_081590 [Sandaracinaceae bacterium]